MYLLNNFFIKYINILVKNSLHHLIQAIFTIFLLVEVRKICLYISILFFDICIDLLSSVKYVTKYKVITIIELITIFNKSVFRLSI